VSRAEQRVGGPSSTNELGRPRRILVVANETVAAGALREEIRRHVDVAGTEILVVCPALNSRMRRWLSDEDGARAKAEERLIESLSALAEVGIEGQGVVGDSDPVQAIEDALCTFAADELIISTHPRGRSNWLEKDVVNRAFLRFQLPITHVVVNLAEERSVARTATGSAPAARELSHPPFPTAK
jgi:hypothetical protein